MKVCMPERILSSENLMEKKIKLNIWKICVDGTL